MTEERKPRGQLQLLLIAAVFLGPLAIAAVMYYSNLLPDGRANHGALLEPFVNLADELPDSAIVEHGDGHWLLVYEYAPACDDDCRFALYTIRQSRLMLGREMDRLKRVFLHGEVPPDTVFLAEEHPGLIALSDAGLSAVLNKKKPDELPAGGFYLVDPLGNLVMYFQPGIDPGEMVDDIKRLLKLSRIG